MRWRLSDLLVISLFWISPLNAKLIPRELLFSYPDYTHPKISPDGKFLGFIKEDQNNVTNVFLRCLCCNLTRQVTFERKNDVLGYAFTALPDIIYYAQDRDGDENTMLFAKNISQEAIERGRSARSVISDRKGVKADVLGNNYVDPRLLIGLNDEDPSMPNIYSYDLLTNELTLVMRNRRFPALFVDNALNIRLAAKEQPDGTVIYYRLSATAPARGILTSDEDLWEEILSFSAEDAGSNAFMGFDKSNENIYWLWADDSSDLGKLKLDGLIVPQNPFSGKFIMFPISSPRRQTTLFQPKKGEIGAVFWNFTERSPLAVSEVYHKHEWYVLNETAMDDMQVIVDYNPTASPYIVSYSVDQELILLTYDSAEKPFNVYLYRRANKSIELLFNTKPSLQEYRFNSMVGFVYTARDGLPIQAYLSLPPDTPLLSPAQASPTNHEYAELGLLPSSPQKMVIMVHGGPQSRDVYGFNTVNAWLTNRGYAVLQEHNVLAEHGFTEEFLHNCLGGEYEPFSPGQYGSSAIVVSKGFTTSSVRLNGIRPDYSLLNFSPSVFTPVLVKPNVRTNFSPQRVTPSSNRIKFLCSYGC
ncbi:hypothetical protein Aduo_007891 [Ancylostoma duodenale]